MFKPSKHKPPKKTMIRKNQAKQQQNYEGEILDTENLVVSTHLETLTINKFNSKKL
jgi:hypothetical protein